MTWLIETYLKEGIFDGFKNKKVFEKQKGICTIEQYEKYIKADATKAFNDYVKVLKSAISKNKTNKIKFKHLNIETRLKKSTDTFFEIREFDSDSVTPYSDVDIFIKNGTIALFYFDLYKYSDAINIPAREIGPDFIDPIIEPITNVLEKYNCKISNVSFAGLDNGADWDDYIFLLKFSKEFFTSRIK